LLLCLMLFFVVDVASASVFAFEFAFGLIYQNGI